MNGRHVALIARVDIRRRFRSFVGNSRRLAISIVVGVFMLLPLGAAVFAAFILGQEVGAGDLELPIEIVRGGVGVAMGLVAVVVAIRAVQTAAVPTNADGLLVWADHSEVVVAVLFLETLVPLGLFGIPAFAAAVAFALGLGTVATAVSIWIAAFAIIVLGALLGMVSGFALRIAIARSAVLARYRTAIAVILFLGYFGVIVSNESAAVLGPVVDLVSATPLGWYGDLALIGAPVDASPASAVGALVLTVVGTLGLGVLSDRLAALLWYETPVEPVHGDESAGMGGDVRYVPRQVARVARKQWLRAWRSPIRLLYVAYPAFFLVGPMSQAFESGQVPSTVPAFAVMYGAWATGAAFTLNVVGDEGNVLPVTLSTPVSGRSFVGGCCLAGLVIGVPVTAVLAVPTAVLAGFDPVAVLVVATIALALPVGATGLASGVGVFFPRTESVRVTRGREAIVPSLFAFAIYSFGLVVTATPVTIVQIEFVRSLVADAIGVSPTVALLVGTALTVVGLGVLAAISFRYACTAFDDYRI